MAVYYFHGSDTYAARAAIGQLAKQHSAVIKWLDKEDFDQESPAHWFSRGSATLFGHELLVVRDLSQLALGLRQEIARTLSQHTTALVVFWERGQTDKNDPLYRQYQADARSFNEPSAAEIARWLIQTAEKQGGSISPDAARLMVDRVGLNKWQLVNELDKLLSRYTTITIREAEQIIAPSPEAEIFSVLDALTSGQKQRAIAGIQNLLQSGSSEFYLLSMLAYQFRTLLLIRSGQDRGLKQFDVVKEAKLKTYTVQKNWQQAAKKSFIYWRDALTRILATDVAIKSGKIDPRTAVLMLVTKVV